MAEFVVRTNHRFKELVPVQYRGEGIAGEGIMKDLSLSGGSITGHVPVAVGAVLALQIFVPGDPEPLLIEGATVQWVKGSDFGINLGATQGKVAERITKVISTLVQKNHGAPRKG